MRKREDHIEKAERIRKRAKVSTIEALKRAEEPRCATCWAPCESVFCETCCDHQEVDEEEGLCLDCEGYPAS